MFAAQHSEFIDRVELERVQARNLSSPSFNDLGREPERAETREIHHSDGIAAVGKRRMPNRSRRENRPRELAVEGAADIGMLFAADAPSRVRHLPDDVLKHAQHADAVTFPDFLWPL